MARAVTIKNRRQYQAVSNPNVFISAPEWVKQALQTLVPKLEGTVIHFEDGTIHTIGKEISLKELIWLTRVEQVNTNGIILKNQYTDIDMSVVRSLRDLVREVVIVGDVVAKSYGGYPSETDWTTGERKPTEIPLHPPQQVFVCDLPGLQFQKPENTARIFSVLSKPAALATEQGEPTIDDAIFQAVVGESKATYQQCQQDSSDRYEKVRLHSQEQYFDTLAYRRSIAKDFIKAATTLNAAAERSNVHNLCFKFLQQGMGYFAETSDFHMGKSVLHKYIGQGILDGLKALIAEGYDFRNIKALELPFFPAGAKNEAILKEIESLCNNHHIKFFGRTFDDALYPRPGYTIATTNCGDPHANAGNEMKHGSVDAAIAENLECKANSLSAFANQNMEEAPMPTPQLSAAAPTTQSLFRLEKTSSSYKITFSAEMHDYLVKRYNTTALNQSGQHSDIEKCRYALVDALEKTLPALRDLDFTIKNRELTITGKDSSRLIKLFTITSNQPLLSKFPQINELASQLLQQQSSSTAAQQTDAAASVAPLLATIVSTPTPVSSVAPMPSPAFLMPLTVTKDDCDYYFTFSLMQQIQKILPACERPANWSSLKDEDKFLFDLVRFLNFNPQLASSTYSTYTNNTWHLKVTIREAEANQYFATQLLGSSVAPYLVDKTTRGESVAEKNILLRTVQIKARKDFKPYYNDSVIITAPPFVKEGLQLLVPYFKGTVITFPDNTTHTIGDSISLLEAQWLGRTHYSNTTGMEDLSQYQNINFHAIVSLRDLNREAIIGGETMATHYGILGDNRQEYKQLVYIADKAGHEVRQPYNTGHFFLIFENSEDEAGIPEVNNLIFNHIVGEKKQFFAACSNNPRYIWQLEIASKKYYFDIYAYVQSIKHDVIQTAITLNTIAEEQYKKTGIAKELCFKFLQQGMGAFSVMWDQKTHLGDTVLKKYIGLAIYMGIDELFKNYAVPHIKGIELPFFPTNNDGYLNAIAGLCEKNKVAFFGGPSADSFYPRSYTTAEKPLIPGTNSCGNMFAPHGNTMAVVDKGHLMARGADAAQAENEEDKGNSFNPYGNKGIREIPYPQPNKALSATTDAGAAAAAVVAPTLATVRPPHPSPCGSSATSDPIGTETSTISPKTIMVDIHSRSIKLPIDLVDSRVPENFDKCRYHPIAHLMYNLQISCPAVSLTQKVEDNLYLISCAPGENIQELIEKIYEYFPDCILTENRAAATDSPPATLTTTHATMFAQPAQSTISEPLDQLLANQLIQHCRLTSGSIAPEYCGDSACIRLKIHFTIRDTIVLFLKENSISNFISQSKDKDNFYMMTLTKAVAKQFMQNLEGAGLYPK
jgi:hypothetical protein